MNLFDVKSVPVNRKYKKRVARGLGSGVGKTAGRGIKGASSRSGFKKKKLFEGGQTPLFRRLPKRGFNNKFKKDYVIINLKAFGEFEKDATVDIEKLKEAGLVKKVKDGVKVLGDGEIKHPLTIVEHKFSKIALQKIKAAGGEAKVLS